MQARQITILMCVVLGVGLMSRIRGGEGRSTVSLAVFSFDNLTGSDAHAWIGAGFAEALTDKLRQVDRIQLRSRREVADLVRVHAIAPSKIAAKDAGELRRLVGSDYLIFGAVQSAGAVQNPDAPLRVTARLVEVRTGRIGKAVQLDGRMRDLFSLQTQLAIQFTKLLHLEVSVVALEAMKHHGTDSLEAYKLYCEGLRLLDAQAYLEAMKKFRAAGRKHPGILYAEAHYALGTAYLRSGRTEEMLKEFRQDVAQRAPIWYDLGVAYEQAGKFDEAVEAFQTFLAYTDRRVSPWDYGGAVDPHLPASFESDALLLMEQDGTTHGLDVRSGKLRWRKTLDAAARPMTLAGGYAYFGTARGVVHAVHGLTGAVRWTRDLDAAVATPVRVIRTEKRALAVVGLATGDLVALDAQSGAPVWRRQSPGPTVAITGNKDFLYLGDDRGRIVARQTVDGDVVWQMTAPGPVKQAQAGEGRLFVATADGRLACYRVTDGKLLWMLEEASGTVALSAAGCLRLIEDQTLVMLDRDGRERWRKALATRPLQISVTERVALVLLNTTLLLQIDLDDGRILERRRFDREVAAVEAAGSLLIVRTVDGEIEAHGLTRSGEPDDRRGYLRLAEVLERQERIDDAIEAYRQVLDRIDPYCGEAMHGLIRLYKKTGQAAQARDMMERLRAGRQP